MYPNEVPDWFKGALQRALFMHFSPFPETGYSDAKNRIMYAIQTQSPITGKHTGRRLMDDDAAYLIATLIWTDLAKAPGSISLAEALTVWRIAEESVLGPDIINGFRLTLLGVGKGVRLVSEREPGWWLDFPTRDAAYVWATENDPDHDPEEG